MALMNKIRALCSHNQISITKLENALGYGHGAITRSTASSLRSDRIQGIASYFEVTPTYLMTEMKYNVCPVCGIAFDPLDQIDIGLHEEAHQNYLNLRERIGYLLNPSQAATKRIIAKSFLEENDIPDDGKVFHYETLVQCDFSEYAYYNNFVVDISYSDFLKDEIREQKYFDLISPSVINNLSVKYNVDITNADMPIIEQFQTDKRFMANITDLWDLPESLREDVYKAIRHAKRDYADKEYFTNPYASVKDVCYDYDVDNERCKKCSRREE